MNDENKNDRDIALGLRAHELLNNDLLRALFKLCEQDAIDKWTNALDPHFREEAWNDLQASRRILAKLEMLIMNGNFAQATINLKERHGAAN